MILAIQVWTTVHRHSDDRQASWRERFRSVLGLGRAPKLDYSDDSGGKGAERAKGR